MSPARDLLLPNAWKSAREALARTKVSPSKYDAEWYLPNDLLRKTDLATMYASIEGRVPLVDREVIEAAQRIATPKRGSRELKPVLKRILSRFVSKELVYRTKSGFGLHLPVFFSASVRARADLDQAIVNLRTQNLLPLKKIPATAELISRYPNLAWAMLVLDRVILNNELI